MTLPIGPHIVERLVAGSAVDRRRGTGIKAASTRAVGTLLTDEEHTLLRMACLSLGMTNRQFIQEALMFYSMWAVDHARTYQQPSQLVREGIGIRADIEQDIEAWRRMAAE